MRVSIQVSCHRCGRLEETAVVYKTWLEPVYVWQEKTRDWLQTQVCPRCARWSLRYWIRVRWQLRIGRLSRILGPPSYGACHRCHTTWFFAKSHTTPYGGGGCFPLCERCWGELTPEERLPFYEALWVEWFAEGYKPFSSPEHAAMVAAVLAGK